MVAGECSSKWGPRICLLAILAGTCIAYGKTLAFGFAYDDFLQIVYNKQIESYKFLPSYFTNQVWAHMAGQPGNLYRPLFSAWLLLNRQLFGLEATGWHLTTILMHLFATLMVYLVAKQLLQEERPALFAAAVFGVHPVHVEGVAWISGVTEPMTASLVLLSFYGYLKCRERARAKWWLLGSWLCFAGALLSKETAVVLPLVLLTYECLYPREGAHGSNSNRLKLAALSLLPYIILQACYLVIRVLVLHGFAYRMSQVSTWTSILTWPWVMKFYLGLLLAPFGLGPFYDVAYVGEIGRTLVGPLLVNAFVLILLGTWAKINRSRLSLFLTMFFGLTIAPVLVSFVIMSKWEGVHDRYLYLPSVAFCILIGEFLQFCLKKKNYRSAIGVAAVLTLGTLTATTSYQSSFWRDDLSLFTRGTAVAPENVLAKLNLAAEWSRRHNFDQALLTARQAMELEPESPLVLSAAGQAAYFLEDYASAEQYYSRALQLAPAQVDQVYYLGLSRIKMMRYREGLDAIRKGLSVWPTAPGYHYALGLGLIGLGDRAGAQQAFREELARYPQNLAAMNALAQLEAAREPQLTPVQKSSANPSR